MICKRLITQPDSEDIAFSLQHSEYVSHDEEMIKRAPILDRKTYVRTATDKVLEKIEPFDPRYLAARSLVWIVIKGCIGINNKLNLQLKHFNKTTDGRSANFAIEVFLLEKNTLPPSSAPLKKD